MISVFDLSFDRTNTTANYSLSPINALIFCTFYKYLQVLKIKMEL